jgi:glycerol-3-phosphate dehydrogenase
MAMTLADAVLRRLDLGTAGPPAAAEIHTVALTLATELGWNPARVEAEKQALAAVLARCAL